MKPYLLILYLFLAAACNQEVVRPDIHTNNQPKLFPDYTDVTFPVNIAAPNFQIQESGDAYYTEIFTEDKVYFTKNSKQPDVIIPLKKWKSLTAETAGRKFYIRISISNNHKWTQYKTIENTISPESIDAYLVYRQLYPGYELWNQMGIYQRNLTNYECTPIIENRTNKSDCMNCHTFCNHSPENMLIHVRGTTNGTILSRNGKTEIINTRKQDMKNSGAYAAWHPNGRYIALSINEIQQFFHATGKKPVEVSDLESDLMLLDTETGRQFTDSLLSGPQWMETFPTWNPDGKTLYFCRSKAVTSQTPLDSIHYDLYSISFDSTQEVFGNPECLYAASHHNKSISFPRVSPDGKYLMFVYSDYGNFSIWHPESELYLLNLKSNQIRNMEEVNSTNTESFHSWSSSGKWFVFSSKRIDGLWASPFIAAFDPKTGKSGKPFVLPQKNPDFYQTLTQTFNLPELIVSPVTPKW